MWKSPIDSVENGGSEDIENKQSAIYKIVTTNVFLSPIKYFMKIYSRWQAAR